MGISHLVLMMSIHGPIQTDEAQLPWWQESEAVSLESMRVWIPLEVQTATGRVHGQLEVLSSTAIAQSKPPVSPRPKQYFPTGLSFPFLPSTNMFFNSGGWWCKSWSEFKSQRTRGSSSRKQMLPFCSVWVLNGLDDAQQLSLLIQMLISSRDSLTDVLRNHVSPAIWHPLAQANYHIKLTNHYSGQLGMNPAGDSWGSV